MATAFELLSAPAGTRRVSSNFLFHRLVSLSEGLLKCRYSRVICSDFFGFSLPIHAVAACVVAVGVRVEKRRFLLAVCDCHTANDFLLVVERGSMAMPHLCISAALLVFIPSCHELTNLFALKFGHPQGGPQVGDEVVGGQAPMDLIERATHFLHCALQRQ